MQIGKLVSVHRTAREIMTPPEVKACNYTNYNPYGFNPYQLAINAVLILLS